ncbi:7-carboxy-7-deazaguanine synthase QueE [Halobacteriovorax sp. GB3]|uniref:7-carboxy-7-deazaguanine synthase QueE n=1 Tax=Halobacteriovorax sp. GB3 TaxID=2719615 RepID=UPI0023614BCE|nr:7-carboxy-7-deazaguanine synthase QueE [Halobacteriovorax sp. GB3]MDD0853305.1 7-carboxy-7-deazaguanine synthase QueE [Halobacteriovorax sp. GB3]
MKDYLINSIYRATEGEGVLIGSPQVFVRFQGCAIGCLNCDSKDTWDFDGELMDLEEIMLSVYQETFQGKIKRVSITGGDPLHPKHVPYVLELTKKLKDQGYFVNIEAAGTRVVPEIFELVDYISFDYKTPSTGVRTNPALIVKLANQYQNKFQIKSVIETREDFDQTVLAYNEVLSQVDHMTFPWCLTPSYNTEEEFPEARFIEVLKWNEAFGGMFRVIGQQHKWIFGPKKKQC